MVHTSDRSDQIRSDQIRSDQVRSDHIRSDRSPFHDIVIVCQVIDGSLIYITCKTREKNIHHVWSGGICMVWLLRTYFLAGICVMRLLHDLDRLITAYIQQHTYIYTYIHTVYFYPRTLSALPHDHLTALEPGTRSRISARFMTPGHETPRARRGGAPRAEGRSPCPSGDVCAEPLRLEGSPETRGVPSSGAGPSRNGTCSGGDIGRKIRAGGSAINYFWFGRTRVCIALVSLHRVEEWVLSGKKSYHGASQSGTCLGGGIGSKIRAGKNTANYFRFWRTRVYIRQSDCTE